MRLGFGIPTSGSWATVDRIDTVVARAEALGYTSLWTFQRLLAPVGDDGADRIEPQYRMVHDPLTLLAYVAARTTTARLGVAVVNAPYYSPTMLAKALATVDILSGGRLDVGLGLGWLEPEFVAAGASFAQRGTRLEEFVGALDAIWADGTTDFQGSFYRVPPSRIEPKPVQRPRPPILFGGTAERSLRRAGRLADGWVSSSRADLTTIDQSIAVVKQAAEEAGRDPDGLRFVSRAVAKVRQGERAPLVGTLDEIRRDLADLARSGLTEAFVDLNFDPEVSSPDVDPDASLARALAVMEVLAPHA